VKRGDIVLVVPRGHHDKPRPAVIVQSDLFNATHASLLVCLLTTEPVNAPLFRLSLRPVPENGLKEVSRIMVDKLVAIPRDRVCDCIGAIDDATLLVLNRCLALVLGLADV
jgi:mRNA interferase MazF